MVVKANGIPFWGRCTTHFRTSGMFTGGTIWILTHTQAGFNSTPKRKPRAYTGAFFRGSESSRPVIFRRSSWTPSPSSCGRRTCAASAASWRPASRRRRTASAARRSSRKTGEKARPPPQKKRQLRTPAWTLFAFCDPPRFLSSAPRFCGEGHTSVGRSREAQAVFRF